MPSAPIHRSWRNWTLYAIALCGGMLICYHPTIVSGFGRMQSDPGDTVLNHYVLEHSWRWLSDSNYAGSFWSPRFFHPTPLALTYSENLIGAAPVYWALRLGLREECAFQWWAIVFEALNFIAMVVVLRWFGVHPTLAALGGFVFAFGLARQGQLNHQHLLPQCFAPIAVWHFWTLLQAPSRRCWFWLLLFTAWQMLASIHLGYFLLLALGIWLSIIVVADHSTPKRLWDFVLRNPTFATCTAAAWFVGLGLFFRTYYIGNMDVRREYRECLYYMPLIIDWFACPPHTLWALHLYPLKAVANHEKYLCPGLAFWIISIIALVWGIANRRNDAVRSQAFFARTSVVACILLIFLTVRLGETASCWWVIYRVVPGANSIRAIGRVGFVVELLGLIAGLMAAQHCLESRVPSANRRERWHALIFLIAAGEHICFEHGSFQRDAFYAPARERAAELTNADAAIVLHDWQSGVRDEEQEILAAWSGLYANVPMINGYSGRNPTGFPNTMKDGLVEIVRYLGKDWQGRLLVIDPSDGRRRIYYEVGPGENPELRIAPAP